MTARQLDRPAAHPTSVSRARATVARPTLVLTAALIGDGLLHVAWAAGMTWPAADSAGVSRALLGFVVPFGAPLLLGLAALLWSAAALLLLARRRPVTFVQRCVARLRTTVLVGVTTALLLRTMLGCWWCFAGGDVAASFYWLNLAVYTPLCALLSGCGLVLLRPRRRAATRTRLARVCTARAVTIAAAAAVLLTLVAAADWYAPTPQSRYRPSAQLGAIASRFVDTPVARFHYIRAGHGSPVVLLSPGSAWVFAWLPQFKALAATHTVYAVDLPGQGFTRLRERGFAFDLDAMDHAIGSFLDAQGLTDVALAGNSWSGGWALSYTQRNPARVNRLVLLAPSGLDRPDPVSWEVLKLPLVGAALAHVSATSRQLTAAGARDLFVHRERVTPDLITAFWAPNTFPANLRATVALERRLDWRSTQRSLPATRQPTLVIWGWQDSVLPVDQASVYARRMPDAQIRVLDRCGHALTLDCPDAVSTLMTGFLDDR